MKKVKKQLKQQFDEIIFNFKSLLFKNKDIFSGGELVEYGIVSKESKNRLFDTKNLRSLNNIYYIWDYTEDFKKLIFAYKYKRNKAISKLIAELIEEEFKFILKNEKIDLVVSVPVNKKRKNDRGYNQG